MLVITFSLTALFAVGGFAIDTALYLLKREQVQTIAESIAMAAALSLPNRIATDKAAKEWYEALRIIDGREFLPSAQRNSGLLSVSFDDNAALVDEVTPYVVKSVTVSINVNFRPKIFPIPGFDRVISIVGQATAQLKPTDIFLVFENSASFYKESEVRQDEPFYRHFAQTRNRPDLATAYSGQCFSESFTNFKKGALLLYDVLSQIGTFRVGVITTTSRTGSPFMLADLGKTSLKVSELEFAGDQADFHSTRCAMQTSLPRFNVPENPNSTNGVWKSRRNLSPLLINPYGGNLGMNELTPLLTREALWITQAGYSTDAAFIHPRYYYNDPTQAIRLAAKVLHGSRRDDNLPVGNRFIILLTDDAGSAQTSNTLSEATLPQYCSLVRQELERRETDDDLEYMEDLKLGILYFGHKAELLQHSFLPNSPNGKEVDEMRRLCHISRVGDGGVFFSETSPWVGLSQEDFILKTAPLVALSLKQAELRQ